MNNRMEVDQVEASFGSMSARHDKCLGSVGYGLGFRV